MTFIFLRLQCALDRAMNSEDGQGLTEYALILAMVAIVAIVSLKFLGGRINTELTSVATSL
jgi:pilus assembly protein Flp/PilA